METMANGTVQPCCADPKNRRILVDTPKLTTQECIVCHRKHYRAKLIGLDARSLGATLGG